MFIPEDTSKAKRHSRFINKKFIIYLLSSRCNLNLANELWQLIRIMVEMKHSGNIVVIRLDYSLTSIRRYPKTDNG